MNENLKKKLIEYTAENAFVQACGIEIWELEEDHAVMGTAARPEVGKKDAVFFHVLGVVATVIATIWMYAFGTGDPAEMRYFLGMPMWVSGAIVIYLAMFVVGMIWLVKWEEFPLTARFKKDSMNKKEGGEQA